MSIGPSHGDLKGKMEIDNRAGAANQQAAPNHWTDA